MKILRPAAARQKVGLSRTTFNRAVDAGILPPPVKIVEGGRAVGFFEDELDSYLEARATARDAKLAAAAEGKSTDGAVDTDELAPEEGEDAEAAEDADAVAEVTP